MKEVTLTADEGLAACVVGICKLMRAYQNGKVGYDHGGRGKRNMRERWADTLNGNMAESAANKYRNTYWYTGIDNKHVSDTLDGVQYRSSSAYNSHLAIYPQDLQDHPDKPFLLIEGFWPHYKLVGWLRCRDCARPEWWNTEKDPPCYWVPQEALKPFETLETEGLGLAF